MIAQDACVKQTFFTAPNTGTPKRRERLVRGRKRPRFGRDGRTTQSISRSLDHRSKPNRRGCALCSLISVGVAWLSSTILNPHELVGGVCTKRSVVTFCRRFNKSVSFQVQQRNKTTARRSKKATYYHCAALLYVD